MNKNVEERLINKTLLVNKKTGEFIFNKKAKIGEGITVKVYNRKLEDFLTSNLGENYNLSEIFDFINDNIPINEELSEIYNIQRIIQKGKDNELDILKTMIQDNIQLVASQNKSYEFMFGANTQISKNTFGNSCTIISSKHNNRIVIIAEGEYNDDIGIIDDKLYLWKSDELPTDRVIVIEERN